MFQFSASPTGRRLSMNGPGLTGGPPAFLAPSLTRLPGVAHGFFGREGGVSGGIYASLNVGPGSDDNPVAIAQNRARLAAALGVLPDRLISPFQVHSALCQAVTGPWQGPRPQVDALVTATPGLALCALAADCAPVLLADSKAGVVGAAHAGWRGAFGGVLATTVSAMAALGASPANITAAIGPCIRQPSYEVGAEFVDLFLARDGRLKRFFKRAETGRDHFDLPGFCHHALAEAGVGRIEILPFDTYSEPGAFFSARRAGHLGEAGYGRNGSAIALMV
jgi:hypothetical protein